MERKVIMLWDIENVQIAKEFPSIFELMISQINKYAEKHNHVLTYEIVMFVGNPSKVNADMRHFINNDYLCLSSMLIDSFDKNKPANSADRKIQSILSKLVLWRQSNDYVVLVSSDRDFKSILPTTPVENVIIIFAQRSNTSLSVEKSISQDRFFYIDDIQKKYLAEQRAVVMERAAHAAAIAFDNLYLNNKTSPEISPESSFEQPTFYSNATYIPRSEGMMSLRAGSNEVVSGKAGSGSAVDNSVGSSTSYTDLNVTASDSNSYTDFYSPFSTKRFIKSTTLGLQTSSVYSKCQKNDSRKRQCYYWNDPLHDRSNCMFYHPDKVCNYVLNCIFKAKGCLNAHPFCENLPDRCKCIVIHEQYNHIFRNKIVQ